MKAAIVYDRTSSFLWQHFLLIISMFVMTLGVALCVRSGIGSSVISAIPYVFALAGDSGNAPALTIGAYTYIMNFVLVLFQILILRRQFQAVQLFQLVIGFFFGFLLDINMVLTSFVHGTAFISQFALQLLGCLVLAMGISLEIRCGSVTMPGEGITVAVSRATGMAFARAKIIVDTLLVVSAVVTGYIFFGSWLWNVVGIGTLMAMVLVGWSIKIIDPYMGWFTRLLHCRPGYQRHIYGLARFIYRRFN